jgi:hypothetical protein
MLSFYVSLLLDYLKLAVCCAIVAIMTLQQTMKIPTDRRVVIKVPESFVSGEVSILLSEPFPKTFPRSGKPVKSLRELRGCCKGLDTMEAYFERKRADKLIEEEHEKRVSAR